MTEELMADTLMHLYLRIVFEQGGETFTEEEGQWLREALASVPGIVRVKEIRRHQRAGYATTVDAERENLEELIDAIHARGLLLVM
ncbi:MAG: hypothetical protein JST22_16380 [Bacteroidetes bacterium]|nr:hypothetical protein [Bacteroidota bacterium]